jgi:hypothetical protein
MPKFEKIRKIKFVKKTGTRESSPNIKARFFRFASVNREEAKKECEITLRTGNHMRRAGIDTSRKIVKIDATSFQNQGDGIPDCNISKHIGWENSRRRTKQVDSPTLLQKLNPPVYLKVHGRKKTLCLNTLIRKINIVSYISLSRIVSNVLMHIKLSRF